MRILYPAILLAVVVTVVSSCSAGGSPKAAPKAAAPSVLGSVSSIAALGDSITAGVNACGRKGVCTAASWATGSDHDSESIAQRIGTLNGTTPAVFNDAKSGARAAQLKAEVASAVRQHPDLVTILIGSNDACRTTVAAMTPVAAFSDSVAAALAELRKGLPSAYIFISSVPNLSQIVGLAESVPAATGVWSKSKSCASLLARPDSDDAADVARRAAVTARVDGYNAALQALCASTARCIYDGGALFSQPLTAADLSTIDYFHPSGAGQKVISASAWQALKAYAAACSTKATGQC